MAIYTQLGSASIQAFQWTGQALSGIPAAFKHFSLQVSDGNLHVPTRLGTVAAKNTDWVVLDADNSLTVMPNSAFILLYH